MNKGSALVFILKIMKKKEKNTESIIDKIKALLNDNKKRHLVTLLFILPFLIVIIICGISIYKEAKSLVNLASDTGTQAVSSSYSIADGSYVLRDNATDIQKEYFEELKRIVEKGEGTNEEKAASVVKNFVADFYTFSNKVGQYDVGGMYYVYTPQRKTIYIQARDQFYQYLSNYIDKYGADELLEVESVTATATELPEVFELDGMGFGAYKVTANWTYVSKGGGFPTSNYDTKASIIVIDNNNRYEIAYMGKEDYRPNEAES